MSDTPKVLSEEEREALWVEYEQSTFPPDSYEGWLEARLSEARAERDGFEAACTAAHVDAAQAQLNLQTVTAERDRLQGELKQMRLRLANAGFAEYSESDEF